MIPKHTIALKHYSGKTITAQGDNYAELNENLIKAFKDADEAYDLSGKESPSKELDAQKRGDLSDKLLPCPFCNCKDIRIEGGDSDEYLWRWCGVYCSSCGITYSRKNLPNDSGRQSAINSWNTRTPSQQALDSANEQLKQKQSDLNFIWKWIERATFDTKHTTPEAAISIIQHYDHAPWYNNRSNWDTSHKDYDAEITAFVTDRQKLDSAVEALNSLIGSDGCIGWIVGHDTIKDALLVRDGRLPIESFHPNFQASLREVIETAQKAKAALDSIKG